MIRSTTVVLLALLARQADTPVVEFRAEIQRHLRAAKDTETRRRLERVAAALRDGARETVFGEADVPSGFSERSYSLKKLLAPIQDRRVEGFFQSSVAAAEPAVFVLDEPLESPVGA